MDSITVLGLGFRANALLISPRTVMTIVRRNTANAKSDPMLLWASLGSWLRVLGLGFQPHQTKKQNQHAKWPLKVVEDCTWRSGGT